MSLLKFVNSTKIKSIIQETGDNTCGSISACAIMASLKKKYDATAIVQDGCDGNKLIGSDYKMNGSSLFGTGLSIVKNSTLKVKIHIDMDWKEVETKADDYELPIISELKNHHCIELLPSITVDEILERVDAEEYPIVPHKGHFSPLKGVHGNNNLRFVFDEIGDSYDIPKSEFINNQYENMCLIIIDSNEQE